jgi:polyhydroxyalkanoate synthesis repressor PhaR
MIVKKYSNRRLYDTDESRYITLDELTEKIKKGTDVQVIDAKSGEDLTQATLTQVILESKAAKLLPTHFLARLIRMQDDALAEFFGKYMSAALELYLQARQGAQAAMPYFPFANLPFTATNALARLAGNIPMWGDNAYAAPPPQPPPPAPAAAARGDLDALKSEIDELRKELRRKKR